MKYATRLVSILFAIAMAACGGGGGGGSSSSNSGSVAPVTPVAEPVLSIDSTAVTQTALTTDVAPSRRLTLTVNNPVAGLQVFYNRKGDGLDSIKFEPSTAVTAYLNLTFKAGSALAAGIYTDTVEVKICKESPCVNQISGSPLNITTNYTVRVPGVESEAGMTPLATSSRNALTHNVVDAEFSKALNAVVMVSSWPSNALYVYDAASGTEKQMLLNKLPKAVSVSPDGKTAAVGHDLLISYMDLTTIGQGGVTAKLLDVSADVGDLVLDGRGYVHAFPAKGQWDSVRSINTVTNSEILFQSPVYGGSRGKLHPSGNFLYVVDEYIASAVIEKFDISTGPVSAGGGHFSATGGYFPPCGNFWFKDSGESIYSVCGWVFNSSQSIDLDRTYAGSISLSPKTADYDTYRIVALSQSALAGEIALIEQLNWECRESLAQPNACYSHLALHEDTYMNRKQVFTISPAVLNNYSYPQRGLFVFHRNDSAKILITRVVGISDQSKEFYLSIAN